MARSRLVPQYQTLVTQVTGLKDDSGEDGERLKSLSDHVAKQLDGTTINKAAASVDISLIDRAISGHALKARVNLQDKVSESLENCYSKLKAHIEKQDTDLDSEIKTSRLPDHLQFLIALSQPPSASTLAYAEVCVENVKNPPPAPPPLTWAEILADDPFEGEHWEGILDPITVKDDWDSTPSLSPLNSDDLALDDEDSLSSDYGARSPPLRPNKRVQPPSAPVPLQVAEPSYPSPDGTLFEELATRQYWRNEWKTDVDDSKSFDLGDPSTLGPSLNRIASEARIQRTRFSHNNVIPERYIDEEDMVREVLMALQGRDNIALSLTNGRFQTVSSTPRLVHLSIVSQTSILESFGNFATTVHSLRSFTKGVFSSCWTHTSRQPQSHYPANHQSASLTRTSEAFADAVDQEVRTFDAWCAAREEQMCRASQGLLEEPLVVSLLETQSSLSDEFDTAFAVIHEIVQNVFDTSEDADNGVQVVQTKRSPAVHSTFLLDTLFSTLQEHAERNSAVVSRMLMRVFVRTAEPIWAMVGKWLRDGMNIRSGEHGEKSSDLDEEFFIESSGVGIGMMSMGLFDPDFWTEGYCLRDQLVPSGAVGEDWENARQRLVPSFLDHIADPILGTGKAIGLARVLGLSQPSQGLSKWLSFADVIYSSLIGEHGDETASQKDRLSALFSVSVDSLSRIVYDWLWPVCEATGDWVVNIIVDDCEFWRHMSAIEDLFLMRRGDALSHLIDLVFLKMDSNQPWADFHSLNKAFGDVVRSTLKVGVQEWIQVSLVRLSYRGHRDSDKQINRTVKAIEGLQIEYAVPFPLTYVFRPEVVQKYSEIFVFLLQIRRAKHVLERILVRGDRERDHRFREELKLFYAMRSRLSWFINTLLTFLTTYVLHVQLVGFHEELRKVRSLDEIIQVHDQHVSKLQARCFLDSNLATLHRSILSILDMCLHFSSVFTAFAGSATATHDVSSLSMKLKHRSRRQKRQHRNVIGFSQSFTPSVVSSDEDSDDDEFIHEGDSEPPEPSFSMEDSMLQEGADFFGTLEQMSKELDGLGFEINGESVNCELIGAKLVLTDVPTPVIVTRPAPSTLSASPQPQGSGDVHAWCLLHTYKKSEYRIDNLIMSSDYVDRKKAAKSYRPVSGTMSEGLKRAREPYRIRNALVGLGLGAFAVGVWAYSISAVKQDEFDDVDEEAKALGAGAGAANALAKQGEPASSAPVVPMPTPKEVAAVAQATANIVLPGTLPLPPVTKPTPSPPTSSSPPPRGILQLLDKRWPRVLDPDSKTVVWGAPSVDNVGRMGGSRS